MRAIFSVILLYALSTPVFSQSLLRGVVKDSRGDPVFSANVRLKHNWATNNLTNLDGQFEILVDDLNDTLSVFSIGYKVKEISLKRIIFMSDVLTIILKDDTHSLAEVIITARSPISKDFSAVQLGKLDVYLNPAAQADPLKSISFLPSSTTTNESANPSFRGSSIDRTRVALNGVPIYQPVRNTQINNIGNFSIFNTEIIDKQYVYAGNPPLTYGNTSSGLVEIETINDLEKNQLQCSATLATLNVFLSQKLNKNSFTQIFSNYQFSKPFIELNKARLTNLNSFGSKDGGINFSTKFARRLKFNSFNYYIDESYDVISNTYTYTGPSKANKKRFFTVNNLLYYGDHSVFRINTGFDQSKNGYMFGNINSNTKTNQIYTALNYKHYFSNSFTFQLGANHDYQENTFDDKTPVYFYAQSPTSPSEQEKINIHNHNLEAYIYFNWDIGARWTIFSGARNNIPIDKQSSYISEQLGLKYAISNNQSLSLSGGQYHNYSSPNFFNKKYTLLKSQQIALDYTYKYRNTLFKASFFYTKENGEQFNDQAQNTNTIGNELFYEQNIGRYLKFTFANTYIKQTLDINRIKYKGERSLNFFIKTSFGYNNPELFSSSITYITRPGNYYTPVISSSLNAPIGFYEPKFSDDLYSRQFGSYNTLDLTLSKYFQFNGKSLICFASLNNILNTKNESDILYNIDYSKYTFEKYQPRTVYFGVVWSWNY